MAPAAETRSSGSGRGLSALILAAGRSTRMKSDRPKVMHEICGRPMLSYVLDACREAGVDRFSIVVGFGKEEVIDAFSGQRGVEFVEQNEQRGTGHAVMMCGEAYEGFVGDCVVIAGDMPLVRADTLRTLIGGHRASGAAASLATTVLDDPTSYGRIVRDESGSFLRIVEDRDCSEDELAIKEVNPSYYCFDAQALFASLGRIKTDNAKGEYYITDVLDILRQGGKAVRAETSVPAEDATGINSRADLAVVAAFMQRRIQAHWMDQGVSIIDPRTTWIDASVEIGAQTVIHPFTYLEGNARIGGGCAIGPFAFVRSGAVVLDESRVGPGALSAFDSTTEGRQRAQAGGKRSGQVVRRPPAQSGIA